MQYIYEQGKIKNGYNSLGTTPDKKSKLSDWEDRYKQKCSVKWCRKHPTVLAHVDDTKTCYFTPLCSSHNGLECDVQMNFISSAYFAKANTSSFGFYENSIKKANKLRKI